MYKFLILLLVFVSVDCHCRSQRSSFCKQRHRLQRYNNRHYEKIFDDITNNVINTDLKYYDYCIEKRDTQIREYYGVDFYTLKYPLPEYEEKDIIINLRHRVIYLKGQRQNGQIFRDIRILPQPVQARDGQWFKENDDIVIQFPYKTRTKTETTVSCDAVDNQLHIINRLNRIADADLGSLGFADNQTGSSDIIIFNENAFVAESHHRCHGDRVCKQNYRLNRHNDRHYEKIFEKTSRSTIAADREVQHGCSETNTNPINEVFGSEFYVLKYNLPDFVDGDISIRIKHRVIYLSAIKSNGLAFRDVRILPQVVKTLDAQWLMEDGDVNVLFTYKNPLGKDTAKTCDEEIIETVLTIPKSTAVLGELRSGDLSASPRLADNVTLSASV